MSIINQIKYTGNTINAMATVESVDCHFTESIDSERVAYMNVN